jgi:protease-4
MMLRLIACLLLAASPAVAQTTPDVVPTADDLPVETDPVAPDPGPMEVQVDEPDLPDGVEVAQAMPLVGWLELSGPLREGPPPFAWMTPDEAGPSLGGVLEQLRFVQDEPRYQGVVIHLDLPELSMTQAVAIAQAVRQLRESGRTVMTFAEAYDTRSYMIASEADLILLQHRGEVALQGLAMEEMYLAGLLEMIGVEADLVQVGQFKGADEQFTRTEPSEAWSQNIDQLLDGLYAQLLQRIGTGRGWDADRVEQALAEAWLMTDRQLIEAGVVDRLVDRDLVDVTSVHFGDDFAWDDAMGQNQSARMAANPMAMFTMLFQEPSYRTTGPTIAVVHARGAIHSGDSSRGEGLLGSATIGSRTMTDVLSELAADDNVEAIVLRLDSPGGSALASEVIWQSLRRVAQDKPLICSVGGMAASGGYYMASAAHDVYVEPSSILGSIGVVGGKLALGGLYDHLRIHVTHRGRGPNATLFSSAEPFTDAQRQQVRRSMQLTYEQFLDRVQIGRGARLPDIDAVDEGMLFTGERAVQLGMADEVGTLREAIAAAADDAELEDGQYRVMHFPGPMSLGEFLEGMFGGTSAPAVDANAPARLTVQAARTAMGESVWQRVAPGLRGLLLLRDEHVLTLMPEAIILR